MRKYQTLTCTAICLLLTIFTSTAVAQTRISTIEDLNNIRYDLDDNYVLTKNLDFAQGSSYASGTVNRAYRPNRGNPATATNAGFAPIGNNADETDATRFTGTFDGGGFTISNLYVNVSTGATVYAGLFGYVGASGEVQNLGMVGAYVKGRSTGSSDVRAGGLVGENIGTISNSYATGAVTAISSGYVIAGGLVGWNNTGSTILNSYATGDATATVTGSGNVFAGGLAGANSDGTISNSYATGDATATGTGSGNVFAGGLVGDNEGTILNSYATAAITAEGSVFVHAGGLTGYNSGGTIRNSYATGDATATGTGSGNVFAGGLVGDNEGTILNSYATGNATATATGSGNVFAGGLVGENFDGTIRNSYFNSQTTGQTAGAGTATGVTARTTAQLQGLTATATSWNTNNWDFGNTSQYPALRSYKENADGAQIQGDLICPQPAPRASCRSITLSATQPSSADLTSNAYDFGNVVANANATLTYTISGVNLDDGSPLSLSLTNTRGNAFTISPTRVTSTAGAISQTVTVTFNPSAEENYGATITHTGAGLKEPLLVKLSGTGTADNVGTILGVENTTTAIHLFPNPVTNQLRVQGSGNLQVQVRSISGVTILSAKITNTGNLDFTTLPSGLYIVSIQSDAGTQAQLILKR